MEDAGGGEVSVGVLLGAASRERTVGEWGRRGVGAEGGAVGGRRIGSSQLEALTPIIIPLLPVTRSLSKGCADNAANDYYYYVDWLYGRLTVCLTGFLSVWLSLWLCVCITIAGCLLVCLAVFLFYWVCVYFSGRCVCLSC